MAGPLAKISDFVSIGTNDLTQYTLSADRNNVRLTDLYNPLHPAVLNLINTTIEACYKHNKPVTVCGEIAGDLQALPLFVGMGVTCLSMNPAKISDACRMVKKIDYEMIRNLARSVVSSRSAASVNRKLRSIKTAIENNN